MNTPGGYCHSNFSVIIFIVTASSMVCCVTGFGVFDIKIVSLDDSSTTSPLPGRCTPGTALVCMNNETNCQKHQVVFTACLSHHQLPLPLAPQCTFGREELTIPHVAGGESNNHSLWKPDVLMSIPFTFSWPAGFTLSVSASWQCHVQDSTDNFVFSNIRIADHIFPSHQWTSFTNHRSEAVDNLHNRHAQSPTSRLVNINNQTSIVNINNQTSRREEHVHERRNSLSKIYYVNSTHTLDTGASSVQTSVSDVTLRETDYNSNIHNTTKSQTTFKGIKVLKERSEFSRTTNIHWGSRSEVDTEHDSDVPRSTLDVNLVSTSATVKHEGNVIFIAIRLTCQLHYFGNSCSKLCRPRDNLLGHYSCSQNGDLICLQGWTGHDCTEAICSDRCLPSHGTCTSPYTCTCRHGWYGEHCDRCRTYPGCKHGTCHIPGQCLCHTGWTGPLCDVEELFCLEHRPCQNGGTCFHDNLHNYTCNCPLGFTGTHCEVALCHHNFCLHRGVCQIAEGTRYCLCPPQYAGSRCQHWLNKKYIHASSTACGSSECLPNSDSLLQHKLQLPNSCQDASCLSEPHQIMSCQDILCYNNGTCFQPEGLLTPECRCPSPFTGSQCLQVSDPCESSPCQNGATCQSTFPGSFMCVCMHGYYGNVCDIQISPATKSLTTQVCHNNLVCQNGGVCEKWQRSGQLFCQCSSQFTGEFCEIDNTNPCSAHMCLNGGTCVVASDSQVMCVCRYGFTGHFCQRQTESLCSQNVCQNGGTCVEYRDQIICSCGKKYEGVFCEKRFRKIETTISVHNKIHSVRNEKLEVTLDKTRNSTFARFHVNKMALTICVSWILCYVLL